MAIALFTAYNMKMMDSFHPKFFIFNIFCTLFAYNFPRYMHVKNNKLDSDSIRDAWYREHLGFLRNISTISFFGAILYMGHLSFSQYLILVFIAIISILYVAPYQQLKSLRTIPYLKPFIISICWVFLTLVIPYLFDDKLSLLTSALLVKMFLSQFIIIFVTAVLFDLRDVHADEREGIKTIANQFSLRSVKVMCYILLYCRMLFCIDHEQVGLELIFSLILSLLVYLAHARQPDNFFVCLIDGSLVLYPLMMMVL